MQRPNQRIVDLILSLFDRDQGQLHRFARKQFGENTVLKVDPGASFNEQAEQWVDQLDSYGLINDAFFDALVKRNPERDTSIEEVRLEVLGPHEGPISKAEPYEIAPHDAPEPIQEGSSGRMTAEELLEHDLKGGLGLELPGRGGLGAHDDLESEGYEELADPDPEPEPELPPAPMPVEPDERQSWRSRMADLLGSVSLERAELPASWLEAAAVLPSFNPMTLEAVGGDPDPPRDLLERLAEVCETLGDGTMVLDLRRRQEVLARLVSEGRLAEALDANPQPDSDESSAGSRHGYWLRRALDEGRVDSLELRTLDDLQTAQQLSEWLARSELQPFDRDRVASVLERYRRVEPLRRLLGKHFRGRVDEIGELRRHLDPEAPAESPIRVLWGVGGVGKSTLLGKVLLDLEEEGDPWVYLDFDHPEVDPLDPRRLVELLARQLGQFFASAPVAEAFLAVEFAAADDDSLRFDELSFEGLSMEADGDGPTERDLLAVIDRGLQRLPRRPALSVVFDTFEQVQVRGRHAVATVRGLLDTLTEAVPYARILVSGRATVAEWQDVGELRLEDLDDESADAVLQAFGIDDDELRTKVLQRVGTSPLSLRLAADALKSDQLGEADLEAMVTEAKRFELQGQLYTRILGHIRDAEVRRLAHPGLIVRRVTVGVIRDVLADLCEIEPDAAPEIFQRLPDHVALFEPDSASEGEGSALRHRQDVREIMLRLMIEDPSWQDRLREIHDRAVFHYSGRTDPVGRAELVYHRLMRDDDPVALDPLWDGDLVDLLARCWEEPLPERARAWLGPRIGRTHGDLDSWRVEDWEVSAAREAEAHLQTGDFEGVLHLLSERSERSAGSKLHRLEARALSELGRWSEAEQVVERALAEGVEHYGLGRFLELRILAGRAANEQGDRERAMDQARRAQKIAAESQDIAGQFRALELRIQAGDPTARDELEKLFLKTKDARLRGHSELSHRVLEHLHPHSTALLRKVASAFGNRAEQNVIRQDAFQLEDLLLRVERTDKGKEELSKLAVKVGLPEQNLNVRDLASQSIRYSKLGDAMVTVLDNVGDDDGVRAAARDMLRDYDGKGRRKGKGEI